MNVNIPTIKGEPALYLACYHDRHTDDQFIIFTDDNDAKNQCRKWMAVYKTDLVFQNQQYGDWCLYLTDDYYAFVQKVEFIIKAS